MRGPSIQRTITYSALLHLTFLALAVVMISYSRNVVMPSAYTVSLVNLPSGRSSEEHISGAVETAAKTAETKSVQKDSGKMVEKPSKSDDKRIEEKMSELSAKRRLIRNSELRQKMAAIAVRGSGAKSGARASDKAGPAGGPMGTADDIYRAKITEEIQREWIYPEYMKKDHQAIVSVTILKDGTLKGPRLEKKSGDLFFDNSVLKAVIKASPVTPPPGGLEMEILEITFSL